MSYFGDDTPQQEMYDAIQAVQIDFSLSPSQLFIVVMDALRGLVDPGEYKSNELRSNRRKIDG